jgi:hypothetical protein
MGVALAAIADDDDLLALDQVQVGVAIVINTHTTPVRDTSTRPSGSIRSMNWSILSERR